ALGLAPFVGAVVAAGASDRDDRVSAARALPAAVWAPFALSALPAAIRAFAAFWAWARLTVFARPAAPAALPATPLMARARRDFRRAAWFGWIAPTFAARSRALIALARASCGSRPSTGVVATARAVLTSVFAAERRGWRI